jgi:hypothetical protein
MKKLVITGAVVLLLVGGSLLGQLNQSGGGGSAVTASQAGTWTMQPGNTANTTPWLFSLSQGGNTAQVTAGGALRIDGSSVTQPVSGTLTTVPKTACGTTSYDSGIVAMPTTTTTVTTTSTCVDAVLFVNITASTQTITLTDNQGSPVTYLASFQVPANSTLVYDLHFARLASGIRWSATSASSVNAQIVGFQ